MAWNKDLPLGTKAGNLLDDDIRANNDALETALGEEHVFSTGGDQTGKHAFHVELEATRDGDTDYVAGSFSITTDTVTGQYVLNLYDGSSWHTVLDAFLNNQNDWVKGQFYTPVALTPGASVSSDWTAGNVFTLAIDQDCTLANPTVTGLADKGAFRIYIITQDNPARTLSYGSLFTSDGKTTSTGPALSTVVGSMNVLLCVLEPDDPVDLIHVSRLHSLATDAEAQAGTSVDVAVTPANLGSNFDATAQDGYAEIIGTGMIVQGGTVVVGPASGTENYVFAASFASAAYTVVATSQTWGAGTVTATPLDANTVTIQVEDANPARTCHVIAIGPKG